MAKTTGVQADDPTGWRRYTLAYAVLGGSFFGIAILAIVAIWNDPSQVTQIMTVTLPLFASWVGIILAFYFGDKNFETANSRINEIIKSSREERAQELASNVMRSADETITYKIPEGKEDKDIILKDLREMYTNQVTRLPVVNPDNSLKYLIHAASVDKYLVDVTECGGVTDTLEKFIENRKKCVPPLEFGFNKGFVIVSEKSTLAEGKAKMDVIASCQDIFVTKDGSEKKPIIGWISNIRLEEYLNV